MIRLKQECADCLAGKYTQKYPKEADEAQILAYQEQVRRIIAEADPEEPAPVVVRNINNMREELLGSRIVYTEFNSHFNQLMLKIQDRIWKQIETAEDPLLSAIRYAITGNYIDLGAFSSVDEQALEKALREADELPLDLIHLPAMKADLAKARELVYLTDNCGEIVMDKLLIRVIHKLYPQIRVTVIVKGAEVLNDACMTDALEVDLTSEAHVITNGNNIAGCWLPEFSEEARIAVEEADIILSKGQANFETMRCCGLNVYYMFLCKCDFFARMFGVPHLTAMLTRDREIIRLEKEA